MKHLILVLTAIIGFAFTTQAQEESAVKPVQGDVSLGFRITGLGDVTLQPWSEDAFGAPQLLGRYYLTNQLALRARIGLNVSNQTTEFSTSFADTVSFPVPVEIDSSDVSSISQSVFSFTPGAEWHFLTDNKLDPYVGAEILLTIKGSTTTESDQEYRVRDENGAQLLLSELNTKVVEDGGINVGFGLIGGFNYFFSPKVALGAEYGIAFAYNQDGGNVRVATTGRFTPDGDVQNIISIDETQVFQSSVTGTTLNTLASGAINLSIFF